MEGIGYDILKSVRTEFSWLLNQNKYISCFRTRIFSGMSAKPDFLHKRFGYGTGSTPPGLNGWHRNIRFAARQPPFSEPYLETASTAYSEHDG